MLKSFFLTVLLAVFSLNTIAQNRGFAQKTIDTLASEVFYGRGYVNDGDKKAAMFLVDEYVKAGLKPLKKNISKEVLSAELFLYPFSFSVNTFPGKCDVKIDGKELVPGKDFVVNPGCPSIKKSFSIKPANSNKYQKRIKKTALLYDTSYKQTKTELVKTANFNLKITLQKKLTWSVATYQDSKAGVEILKASLPANAKKISVNIKSKLINHEANNVIGYIEGTEIKDTFILLTAHYDHLGMMGKTMFPGANDNASGVAMMLDMANYFSKHPSKYSIAFIAFAAEEPGLIGSKHYTDNPWAELPLSRIKFLVNLDLMGSGEKGIAVVNSTIFPDYFKLLQTANGNSDKKYLTGFKSRGKAANSDHYWFVERGVKGFFFYLMGDYNHYHDIDDNRYNLKLGEFYDKSFLLIRDFILSI